MIIYCTYRIGTYIYTYIALNAPHTHISTLQIISTTAPTAGLHHSIQWLKFIRAKLSKKKFPPFIIRLRLQQY